MFRRQVEIAVARFGSKTCLLAALALLGAEEARADACPAAKDELTTDRPDVTNSSLVVPTGSFQSENGTNLSGRGGAQTIDGTNTRWRLGVAPCLEFLVDLPTYNANVRQPGSSGFSDVSPAVKWQISPAPGTIDLSIVSGVALPTGTAAIAGRGAQPYLQFPWSWELHGGWGVSGMFTAFWFPRQPKNNPTVEPTLAVERQVGPHAEVFLEYVGDFPHQGMPSQLIDSGGAYRITPQQQLDFHLGFGIDRNLPKYFFGVGYSFRIDSLF